MTRTMLKSKIHRATVTEANIEYEGSVTIDPDLLDAADMLPYEKVDIWVSCVVPFTTVRRGVYSASSVRYVHTLEQRIGRWYNLPIFHLVRRMR